MIGKDGENLGVMKTSDALALAVPAEGLDLIETNPTATPPIVRVMSFDKYRYLREKEEKQRRQAQKPSGVKQVQVSARAQAHDWEIKARQLEKFLEAGHQVEVQLRLRGREKSHKEWAVEKLEAFLKLSTVPFRAVTPQKFGGKGMYVHVLKK